MSALALVLLLLLMAVTMFSLGRPRTDAVAILMIVLLPITDVISVPEALAGFSDPNIVLIAALFVIGDALVRTGVAQSLGDRIAVQAGKSEAQLAVLLMLAAAGIGAFMSSTGVVAIFIPIILRIAQRTGIAAARLLMPLSMAALISGMMTLVATAPNLVVHAELMRQGYEGFGFFSFTPFGLPILLLAVGYVLAMRPLLSRNVSPPDPDRATLSDWVREYGLEDSAFRLHVTAHSPLVGQRLDVLDLRASAGVNIIAVERRSGTRTRRLMRPEAATMLEWGDILLINKSPRAMEGAFDPLHFAAENGLRVLHSEARWFTDLAEEIGMARVMITPESRLVGQSITEASFRSRYDLSVIGMKQGREAVSGPFEATPLQAGDTLLLTGSWRAIRHLREERSDFALLDLPSEYDEVLPVRGRASVALLILALVVVLMISGAVPNAQAALIGCLLLGLAGIVTMTTAYQAIHWPSLVLIVGMMPFSLALQRTGGTALVAEGLSDLAGSTGPRGVLALLFIATAGLGLFISNTATAVLMAPVSIALAEALGVSPYPLAMTVAIAASAAFMTPVSSPVNTLVVGPGNYRFSDFLKMGVPFTCLVLAMTVALVPLILPF